MHTIEHASCERPRRGRRNKTVSFATLQNQTRAVGASNALSLTCQRSTLKAGTRQTVSSAVKRCFYTRAPITRVRYRARRRGGAGLPRRLERVHARRRRRLPRQPPSTGRCASRRLPAAMQLSLTSTRHQKARFRLQRDSCAIPARQYKVLTECRLQTPLGRRLHLLVA
jgi:hypothetical protein